MTKSVFISYAHADADGFARELRSRLIMAGHQAFFDSESITPGTNWEASIEEAIAQADCFIAILSPRSLESAMCNKEREHALAIGKYFIPIFLYAQQDLEPIPPVITQHQGLDFHDPSKFDARFERLLRTIEQLNGPPPPNGENWLNWRVGNFGVHYQRQKVHCIKGNTPLSQAYQLIHNANFDFRHLLVTDSGVCGSPLRGLLSLRRILKLAAQREELRRLRTDDRGVMDVYTPHQSADPTFIALYEDDTLETALHAFTKRLARQTAAGRYFYMSAIPLIDREENAVGIISFKDILHLLVEGKIPIPERTIGEIRRGVDKISFSQPDESFADADIALTQYGPGQRDIPIVDGYETRQLLGLVPDHIFIENFYSNQPIGQSMVPYDRLRVQFLDTPVRDMLDQYVTGDNAKLYYSFAVVTSKRDHSLQGLIGYRDIFAALLGRV